MVRVVSYPPPAFHLQIGLHYYSDRSDTTVDVISDMVNFVFGRERSGLFLGY
jgi:hypothetical protein